MNVIAVHSSTPTRAGHPLDAVICDTEATFLAVSQTLGCAIDCLNGLRSNFVRLEQSLGPDQSESLEALTAEAGRQTKAVVGAFAAFTDNSHDLRNSVRGMQWEVSELVATIRTISIVTLHARILGNSLSRNRARVEAFTVGLTSLADEASLIVQDVDAAMTNVAEQADAMDAEVMRLAQELRGIVLPALVSIGTASEAVHRDRRRLAQGNADLAGRMEHIFGEVAKIVYSLQVGDSARQRLEHVCAATRIGTPDVTFPSTALDGAVLDLVSALTQAAHRRLSADVASARNHFHEIEGKSAVAIKMAMELYLDGPGRNNAAVTDMSAREATVSAGLLRCAGHLRLMSARAGRMAQSLEIIRAHERRMRSVEARVRLVGINAVIVCAKLGPEGRPLQEVARQLRELTDASGTVFTHLHQRVEETHRKAAIVGFDAVAALEEEMDRISAGVRELGHLLGDAARTLGETSAAFDQAGRTLTAAVFSSATILGDFQLGLRRLEDFDASLVWQRFTCSNGMDQIVGSAAEAEVLRTFGTTYTIEDERLIHAATMAKWFVGAEAPALVSAVPEDTPDEIFF